MRKDDSAIEEGFRRGNILKAMLIAAERGDEVDMWDSLLALDEDSISYAATAAVAVARCHGQEKFISELFNVMSNIHEIKKDQEACEESVKAERKRRIERTVTRNIELKLGEI